MATGDSKQIKHNLMPLLIAVEKAGRKKLRIENALCIFVCLQGTLKLLFDNQTHVMEGCCFYVFDTTKSPLKASVADEEGEIYVITVNNILPFNVLSDAVEKERLYGCHCAVGYEEKLKYLVRCLHSESNCKDEYYEDMSSSLLLSMGYLLCRIAVKSGHVKHQNELPFRIKEFIDSNYCEDLSLSSIANEFFISTDHLSHIFKGKFGTSPINYLIQVRLIHAQMLLINTNYPVSRIADMVGYENASYFSTLFRKIMGVTPGSFRMGAKRNI